jgi:exodeoxyribonuclease X
MTDWTERRYAVVDVEGNGQHRPDLVELGVVPIVAGEIGEPVTWLFKPAEPITAMAQRVHGITNGMVAGAPEFGHRVAEVRAALNETVVVAHNAGSDLGVLRRKMPDFAPADVVDTLKLSRRRLPDQASHRLSALAEALHLSHGLPAGLAPHRVTYDVLVTARLLIWLATNPDGTPMSAEELLGEPGGHQDALF